MPLTDEEDATLKRLQRRLDRDLTGYRLPNKRKRIGFLNLDAYYDGEQRLEQLGYAVPEDLREFTTIVAWPGTYVDTIVDRCQVVGFRLPGEADADDGLWEMWQANDLESESALARVDRKVFGRGYYCIGTNDDDPDMPLITVDSPLQMTHEWSNRKRTTTAAARFYVDDSGPKRTRHATLYMPDATIWVVRENGRWVEEDRDDHELGRVPVVPLLGKQRTHDRYGISSMLRLIGVTDAAARALTNAQVATEVMALPQRYAAGLDPKDFKDPETGESLTTWEAYFGAVWSSINKDANFGQFDAADLSNFTGIISHYAQLAAGLSGLPMRYFGQLSDNPPSADGIRADESRLVKTSENDNIGEADALEDVMTIAERFRTGDWNTDLRRLETQHRNPATPTVAQEADAAVKLFQAQITSKRQARRDLGYTQAQIDTMEKDDAEEVTDPTLHRIADGLLNAGTGLGE
ncbi:MAG TPA: phage portal protein [Nocardioides sp.]